MVVWVEKWKRMKLYVYMVVVNGYMDEGCMFATNVGKILIYEKGGFLHGGWVVQKTKESCVSLGFRLKRRA